MRARQRHGVDAPDGRARTRRHQRHLIREQQRFFEIMRHQDHGQVLVAHELQEVLLEQLADDRVE